MKVTKITLHFAVIFILISLGLVLPEYLYDFYFQYFIAFFVFLTVLSLIFIK